MKKDCVISRIEASQDWSPYVYVIFADPNDYKQDPQKAAKSIWSKYDGIYFARGLEEFAKSLVQYF